MKGNIEHSIDKIIKHNPGEFRFYMIGNNFTLMEGKFYEGGENKCECFLCKFMGCEIL